MLVHVAVGGDDDHLQVALQFAQPAEQRQPVHARHVDVREDELDRGVRLHGGKRLLAVPREGEREAAVAQVPPKLVAHEELQVGLVVDDEDVDGGGRLGHGRGASPRVRGSAP